MFASENSPIARDRKSTRLNSSHVRISYAVFCWKKKRFSIPTPTAPGETAIAYNEASIRQILTELGYDAKPIEEGLAVVFGEIGFSFFNDTATTEIYTLSLHGALPIYSTTLREPVPTRDHTERALAALGAPVE